MELDHDIVLGSLNTEPQQLIEEVKQEIEEENQLEPDQFVKLDPRILGVASLSRYKIA